MALLGKARTATGAGVIITVLLVLVFGNQAFTEWVVRHTDGHTVWGWFLRILSWPAWAFGPTPLCAGPAGRGARPLRKRLKLPL